jgi:transcriptional regulator with XRE-family HTH domain
VTKQRKPSNIVGQRIAESRNSSDPQLTQDALSGKLALGGLFLDRAAIAKIETSRRRVLDYELKAFAEALHVSVDWLLGGRK